MKNSFLILIFVFSLLIGYQPLTVLAGNDFYGLETTAANAGLATQTPLTEMIGRVINWALSFLGIIFLLWLLVGGFEWMTAGGNEEKVKKAKMILGTAISGLVIVFIAYSLAYIITQSLIEASS
jgi:hypothetical protein